MQKRHWTRKNVNGRCVNVSRIAISPPAFPVPGAFSDGKLSLSCEVGGELPELIGEELAQKTIEYTDRVYLEFGADTHVEGIGASEQVKQIRSRAIQAGLKLVDCPIRHLGTEKAPGNLSGNPRVPASQRRGGSCLDGTALTCCWREKIAGAFCCTRLPARLKPWRFRLTPP